MSKAMLIMDMPKCCGACKMSGIDVCRKWNMKDLGTFPKNCLLREVPEKKQTTSYRGHGVMGINEMQRNSYERGWNIALIKF